METLDCCPVCYEDHGQAYNGILQLRNYDESIIRFIDSELEKGHSKGKYCIKLIEFKGGIDYMFSSASFTRHIGKLLLQRFGGEFKETARLVTRSKETSKDLYRLTVLFRVPKFKKGEIVSYKGREVKILNFGNKVYISDIRTNKKERVPYGRINARN